MGATQYVQYTNWRFAVYNKTTGAKVLGPAAESTLWTSLGGPCAKSNDGDIIVLYDKQAQRWIFTHHALATGGPFYQCFAVSKTSDATGAYYLYQFQLTNDFPDYPKLGVWADGYYMSTNLENPTTFAWLATQVCAFDRAQMLTGAAAEEVCFQTAQFPSLLPADIDGATAPPSRHAGDVSQPDFDGPRPVQAEGKLDDAFEIYLHGTDCDQRGRLQRGLPRTCSAFRS